MKFVTTLTGLMASLVATGISLGDPGDGVMAQPVAKPSSKELADGRGYSHPLPSFKKGSRLLFQGDSITDMNRDKK